MLLFLTKRRAGSAKVRNVFGIATDNVSCASAVVHAYEEVASIRIIQWN